ncbi:putative phage abortive infection protein [Vibrio fluvialis]|uniref:putative phage abortive infection protein n=1 Tax=Vibrio fluvialis TaxID=676 RepID=UPI001EEA680A|nr:putative phage abortive infection protein [Vibrio fluvialis]MCG6400171.1 hypothetical protein [Vibrio fluvialis]
MELLKYKGYKGSVSITQDGEYTGVVLGLERNAEYTGKSFEELKQQFKCKVENFLHYCEYEGINPDHFVSTEKNTMQSKKYLVVFGVLGFAWLAWLWFYFDKNIGATGIAQQAIAGVGETSDWWKDAGSFFNNFSTPVLSLLSFIALLWTIYQQIASHKLSLEELRYTREELELTRNELKKSADAQELTAKTAIEQQKLIQLQQFESTFFSLLANHEIILSKITDDRNNEGSIADKALQGLNSSDCYNLRPLFNFYDYKDIVSYFIVLYQLLKFIDESNFIASDKDKKKYASLLRSYLNNNVLLLIMYNCYVDSESKDNKNNSFVKYKFLVEKYAILEHVSWDLTSFFGRKISGRTISKKHLNSKENLMLIMNTYRYDCGAFGENVFLAIENLHKCLFDFYKKYKLSIPEYHEFIKNREIKSDEIKFNRNIINKIERTECLKKRLNFFNNIDNNISRLLYDEFKWIRGELDELFPNDFRNIDFDCYKFKQTQLGDLIIPEQQESLQSDFKCVIEFIDSFLGSNKINEFQKQIASDESYLDDCMKRLISTILLRSKSLDGDKEINRYSIWWKALSYHIENETEKYLANVIKRAIEEC